VRDRLIDTQPNRLQSLFRFTSTFKVFNNLGNLRFAQTQPKSPQRQGFCHGFATVHSGWIIGNLPLSVAAVQRKSRPFNSPPSPQTRHFRIRTSGDCLLSLLPSFQIFLRGRDERFVGADLRLGFLRLCARFVPILPGSAWWPGS
jgi:hypothetical protein